MIKNIKNLLLRVVSFVAATAGITVIFACALTVAAVEADMRWFDGMYCGTVYASLIKKPDAASSFIPPVPPVPPVPDIAEVSIDNVIMYEVIEAEEIEIAYSIAHEAAPEYSAEALFEKENSNILPLDAEIIREFAEEAMRALRKSLDEVRPVINSGIEAAGDAIRSVRSSR